MKNATYTLVVNAVGSKFLSIAKAVVKETGRDLEEVMTSLEEPPLVVLKDAEESAARDLQAKLESFGAKTELQMQAPPPPVNITLVLSKVGPKFLKVGKSISAATKADIDQVLEELEELPYQIELPEEEALQLKQELGVLGATVYQDNASESMPSEKDVIVQSAPSKEDRTVAPSIEAKTSIAPAEKTEPRAEAVSIPSTPVAQTAPLASVSPRPRKTSDSVLTSVFEENWQKLEEEACIIKQEKLLPFSFTDIDGTIAERTVEDFDSQLDTLKKEKFTISVCGMVKAGKSTFLNALLFGEDILPAFDTPMTAKLNFIEYTEEKNHFLVNFYDKTEWKELLASLDPENLRQLNERIQLCAEQHGIDQDECIGAPPRKEMDLRKLEEFVSDPKSKKGKYTPFVKDVHIFVHNKSIQDVRIVDTPGLNDPNVINSRETTKWIKNTHALIFLLPNKGLDESSLNFFDTHLLGTRPSNRVWVINKIDDITEEDLQKTKAYIRQLGQQEEFKQKDLFGRDERVCGYSALIAMLKNMDHKGMQLNEDQVYHLDNVGEDFNPDPDKLGNVIGERLYQNTGVKRIVAGFTAINTIYSQHIKNADRIIDEKTMLIEDGTKSDEELQKELEELQDKQKAFNQQLNHWKQELASVVFDVVKDEVATKSNKALDSLDRKMQTRVDACNKADALRGLAYAYRDECNKIFGPYGSLMEGLNDCSKSLQDELNTTIKKIRNLFTQNEIQGSVSFSPLDNLTSIKFDMDDLLDNASYDVSSQLPSNWFSELFSSKESMRAKAKSVFIQLITEMREKMTTNIKALETKIDEQIGNSFTEFSNSIDNSILQKRAYLESGSEERRKTLEQAQRELDAAKSLKERVGDIQRTFKYKFPQEITMNV